MFPSSFTEVLVEFGLLCCAVPAGAVLDAALRKAGQARQGQGASASSRRPSLAQGPRGGQVINAEVLRPFVEQVMAHLEDGQLRVEDDAPFRFAMVARPSGVKVLNTEPPRVRMESIMLTDLPESAKLLRRINELNDLLDYGRIFWHERSVYFEYELLTASLDVDTIRPACAMVSASIGEVSDLLLGEFGAGSPPEGDGHDASPEADPGYL